MFHIKANNLFLIPKITHFKNENVSHFKSFLIVAFLNSLYKLLQPLKIQQRQCCFDPLLFLLELKITTFSVCLLVCFHACWVMRLSLDSRIQVEVTTSQAPSILCSSPKLPSVLSLPSGNKYTGICEHMTEGYRHPENSFWLTKTSGLSCV